MNATLVAVGDLLEDVRVRPDGPIMARTDTPSRIERRVGGSAAEVALAAVGDSTAAAFVGNVGADLAGDRLLGQLTDAGVACHVTRSGRTGTVVALLDADGERTMLTDRGSSDRLAGIEPAWLQGTAVLHLPAYTLLFEPLATAAQRAIPLVRRGRGLLSVDVSSTGTVGDYGTSRFIDLVRRLGPDVLLANRDEADLLASQVDPAGLAGILVVKQGSEPALVSRAGETVEVAVPERLDLRDSTGAGDAFAAGFLGGLIDGVGVTAAAMRGHRVAARTLRAR